MTIREVTMYQIVCDEPDCGFKTGDELYEEFTAWADAGSADECWTDGDNQSTAEGKHYCEKHKKNQCADCDKTANLVNDAFDGSGDWWCPEHLEATPEYEVPGVVV